MDLIDFFAALRQRSEPLFWFTLILLTAGMLFLLLTRYSNLLLHGESAWYKPMKFSFSIALYCATMAWYCGYLPHFNLSLFAWVNIGLFGFEMIYISVQASRGQASHFNVGTPLYAALYGGMALAATGISLYGGYVGLQFFRQSIPELPDYYVWAIRLGILLFFIFSLQGFAMGSRLTHTIGTNPETDTWPIVRWSRSNGDLRVAHFLGMHALQVIPLLAWYVVRDTKSVFLIGLIYAIVAVFTWVQAMQGKPFFQQ